MGIGDWGLGKFLYLLIIIIARKMNINLYWYITLFEYNLELIFLTLKLYNIF